MVVLRDDLDLGTVLHRQLDLFNPDRDNKMPLHVVGVGATGSNDVLVAAKIGLNPIHVWDEDTVEVHNNGGQLYSLEDIGKPKVLALREAVQKLAGVNLVVHNKWWTPDDKLKGIVVCGVDSMETRKILWKHVRSRSIPCPLFIDHRIGGETAILFTVPTQDPLACERFEETLHTDAEAAPLPCTQRGCYDINNIVAGLTVRQIRKWLIQGDKAIIPEVIYSAENGTFTRMM